MLPNTKKIYNPSAAVARNCWLGALIGAMIFLYPIVFPVSIYGLEYTLIFVGIITFLTGLISGLVFKRVAKRLDETLSGEGLLASWTYSAEEWSRYTEAEHLRDKHDKWMLFRLMTIIAVVVGVIFVLFNRDAWLITLITIAGLIVILALTAYFSVSAMYRQNRLHPSEVYIGKSGALLGRTFHYWKMPASFLRSATLAKGDPSFIQLVYSSPSGKARGEYTARLPVPYGREEEAKKVVAYLSADISGNSLK